MAFEKYKARKAAARALHTQSQKDLELAYMKLCHPLPPSYDDIYDPTADTNANSNHSAMTVTMTSGVAPKPFVLGPLNTPARQPAHAAVIR